MAAMLFIIFVVCLVIGVPVAYAICTAAGITLYVGVGEKQFMMVVQRMFQSCDSFALIAVPFFILAGDLLSKGKISKVLVEFCESFLGFIRGGLSIVSVLAGMFFAAISGSGAATTAAVGATLVPELKKRGYEEDSAAALVAAAGTIGVVIPPSVPMVLYAVIAQSSVTDLFKAGFVPGIIMGLALIIIALVQAYKRKYPKGVKFELKNIARTFVRAIPAILMPVIILVGIFSGVFTPSEAAAIAVIYAILVSAFIYRDLTPAGLFKIMLGSARTSAVIMIIIACSGPFGWVLANWSIPDTIASAVLSISTNKYIVMLLVSVIILVAGVFMETSSAIILLSPVFLTLVCDPTKGLGLSTLH
ncbi:MAG: TRAP transporter large permease, partial [Clostridia bacterium]|nr:TRAP transporter large permease [Clostridia bacterium]